MLLPLGLAVLSGALFQELSNIPFPMDNGDNLEGGGVWPVYDGVVGITGQRPETQRTGCEVRPGAATVGCLGNLHATVVGDLEEVKCH